MSNNTEKIIQKHLSKVDLCSKNEHISKATSRLFDSQILYTVADIASLVGCSTRTIERCIERGELRTTRVGRKKLIRSEWLESWLQP